MEEKTQDFSRSAMDQITINSDVNIEYIYKYLQKNLVKIEKIIGEINDFYAEDFFFHFVKKREFKFPINKHLEIFFNYNSDNIDKIVKYLIFRYKFYLTSSKKINIGYPPYILIEPVSACNLRCPFCFQTDKSFTRKPYMGVMDFKLFTKVVDEADSLGVGAITLASRGEPTLHKQIKEMLHYLSTKNNIFEIKINTNASFLTEELCHQIFKSKVTQVVISADHYEKFDFELLRLGADFEKIVDNVDMLFNIRKQYSDAITEIRVSGVDVNKTLDRNKFHDFWIKRSDHVSAGFAIERWDTYSNEIHPKKNDPCDFLWDRMYVWWDGKVNPCDADYKSYLSFGDVQKKSIKKIWNDQPIENIRKAHLLGNRKSVNPCNRCGITFNE